MARRIRLVTALLATVSAVALGMPAATAADGTPPNGWFRYGGEAGGGVELFAIGRDDPDAKARGKVIVLPRTGIYRLRTVLAHEQLLGGSRQPVTTLCARIHCHAAVNGDRWHIDGHDLGRITGALAVDGELIATQPIPPMDPYAHALIGYDGSMAGTIAFPMDIDPTVWAGDHVLPLDVNRTPQHDRFTLINRRYADESRTPAGTVEFLLAEGAGDVDSRTLTPLARRDGSGPIDPGTVVVAANGEEAIAEAEAWWAETLAAGRADYDAGLGGLREIIGGSPLLLANGVYGFPVHHSDGRKARTVLGWDAERILLVTVDGGRPGWSQGVTYREAADLLAWLGATDALNLDGGGSTTTVAWGALRSWPQQDTQRPVASALVVMPPEGRVGAPPSPRSLDPACPPGQVPPAPFPDTAGNEHEAAIACMAWRQIARGTAGGAYLPMDAVRRDQMASFLLRLLHATGTPVPDAPRDAFDDDTGSAPSPRSTRSRPWASSPDVALAPTHRRRRSPAPRWRPSSHGPGARDGRPAGEHHRLLRRRQRRHPRAEHQPPRRGRHRRRHPRRPVPARVAGPARPDGLVPGPRPRRHGLLTRLHLRWSGIDHSWSIHDQRTWISGQLRRSGGRR